MSLVDLGKRLLELAKLGETEEVRQLMTNGAPFTTDWLGSSPLHMAAQYGHVDTAEVLLRAGISRDARTKVDRTPLHIAAQEGHLPLVELLLRHGADVESRDMLRMTSLHWAVERGHPGVIKCLLRHGADVNTFSKFEKTPIDIAADNCREDLVHMLQDHTSIAEKKLALKPIRPALVPANNSTQILLKAVHSKTNFSSTTSGTVTAGDIIKKVMPATKGGKPIILQGSVMGLQKATNNNTTTTDSDEGETDSCSTSVLATLAALAEATAPNSAVSNTDALQWLETHGITMLPADNSTIVSTALEGGQTITLTEAGKLALNWVRDGQHNNVTKVVDSQGRNQKVITIVSDQSQLPSIIGSGQGGIVVVSAPPMANHSMEDVKTSEKGTHEERELKKKLEEVTRQAEEYKAQLQKTMSEAQEYKKQLEKMLHEPSKSDGH